MSHPDFYIGWNDQMPNRQKKAIRKLLIPIFILLPLLAFALVFFSKPFNDHQFELGNVQTFTGVYHETPFPVFMLDEGQAPAGHNSQALLIGYGKFGATGTMQAAAKSVGQLDGKRLRITGTLIYGDGKTLIELTKQEESVLEVLGSANQNDHSATKNKVVVTGEILDPKCWFGVMKPAEGKVHKSCAIRCVSGGIPPVLKVQKNGARSYYILKGLEGQEINQEILEYIAEPIQVNGLTYQQNGWYVLEIDPKEITYL